MDKFTYRKINTVKLGIDINSFYTKSKVLELENLIRSMLDSFDWRKVRDEYFKIPTMSDSSVYRLSKEILGVSIKKFIEFSNIKNYIDLSNQGLEFEVIARRLGLRKSILTKKVTRYNLQLQEYNEYLNYLESRKLYWDSHRECTCTDLVTFDHYKPIIEYRPIGKYKKARVYIPELDRWIYKGDLKDTLRSNRINYLDWECRWYLNLNPDLVGTRLWAERKVEVFYQDKLKYTKKFIIDKLLLDNNYKFNALMVKEDLIDQYYNSRTLAKKRIYSYDFSLVPEILKNTTEYFNLIVKEIDPITNLCLDSIYKTSYRNFIGTLSDAMCIEFPIMVDKIRVARWNIILDELKKIHGNSLDFSSVNFKNTHEYVRIKCNDCGEYFYTTIDDLLGKYTNHVVKCPNCSEKIGNILDTGEVIRRLNELYKYLPYDFSGINYRGYNSYVDIKNTETNEIITIKASTLLSGSLFTNSRRSKGEQLIKLYLDNNNIYYEEQKLYPIKGRVRDFVFLDFYIIYNEKIFVIEYNGKQHYCQTSKFFKNSPQDFANQLKRDENVRNYFKNSSEIFLEIPYTYSTYDQIEEILDSTIKNNQPYNFDYNKLFK